MKSLTSLAEQTNSKDGTAIRQRGKARVDKILKAAQSILITEGFANLSLRKIANKLGISNGNVTYYFPNKNALLRALIEDMLKGYDREFEEEAANFPDDSTGRFFAYIEYLIQDCKKADLRGFFYQIWSIATHNAVVAELRDQIYTHFLQQAQELVRPLNPALDELTLKNTALTLVAMIEGLHVVFGFNPDFLRQFEGFEETFRENAYLVAMNDTVPRRKRRA
ncbi:MAG: TetR/AcrR family transcriptional regulator [Pseudomonadales bacterium]